MPVKSIIIDDNSLSREILSDLIRDNHPEILLSGTAHNGKTAIEKIRSIKPDLIFLDVEMPDMNGFQVLAALKSIDFQTIFVTAYSHYAIQAIRFNALDYIVKPINPKELKQAIKQFKSKDKATDQKHRIAVAIENLNQENAQDQVLFLLTQEGGIKMILKDIIKIEGNRNYSTFHLAKGRTKISSKTLGHFEEILKGKGFFRCHRSFIINSNHIERMQKDSFLLKDASKIPISRRRKKDVKNWFAEY